MGLNNFKEFISWLRNKRICIVYIYQDDLSEYGGHYDVWKSDVITYWMKAIEDAGAFPYVIDFSTFMAKSANNSLPPLDAVLNLVAGNNLLEKLSLVPAISKTLKLTCLPNSFSPTVTGENKHLSNLIAKSVGFNLPDNAHSQDEHSTLIIRPLNLGSSIGVRKMFKKDVNKLDWHDNNLIIQKFIEGFDLTVPVLKDPVSSNFEILPPTLYVPNNMNITWYNDKSSKMAGSGYTKKKVIISDSFKMLLTKMVDAFGIQSLCRVDFRVMIEDENKDINSITNSTIDLKDTMFLEMNAMPTLKPGNNYIESLELSLKTNLAPSFEVFQKQSGSDSSSGFLFAAIYYSCL